MNNPLKIGIIKTRIPKAQNKLRALSIHVNKYDYSNPDKKLSKDRNYLLDGKIKLNNTGVIVAHRKEKIEGVVYSLEIPIKYTKSGVIGLEQEPIIYKSIFINLVLNKERLDILETMIKKLNKFRKAADKEYFNRFNNNRVTFNFFIIKKDFNNLVKTFIIDGPTKDLYLMLEFQN